MPAHTLMPRALIGCALLGATLLASVDASARDCRTIEQSFDAAGLEELSIDVHVGELDVRPSDDGKVHVAVEVCGRTSWFGLRKHNAEDAVLEVDQDDKHLGLAIAQDKYEEDWTVRMPAAVALEADMGVGAVAVTGLQKDISVDVGVGETEISVKAADYGRVSGDVGVGDITVDSPSGESESRRAVVSDSVDWVADGVASINADVGVGDVQVTLD